MAVLTVVNLALITGRVTFAIHYGSGVLRPCVYALEFDSKQEWDCAVIFVRGISCGLRRPYGEIGSVNRQVEESTAKTISRLAIVFGNMADDFSEVI
jgi:hypothetical protein